jgi:2'-5' RNA ligase
VSRSASPVPKQARLFVAVRPPETVADDLDRLPRPAAGGVRWEPPERWHITLCFLASADPAAVTDALDRARLPAAAFRFGPRTTRFGQGVLVVPASGADELAGAVREATSHLVEPRDRRPFVGHLTLARLAGTAGSQLLGTPFDASFDVQRVELVASEQQPTGASHRRLGSWPVGAPS